MVCCAALLCLVTGCSSSARTVAIVHGALVWPRQSQPLPAGARRTLTAGSVEVIKGTQLVAKVSVGRTGRFTVDIPAGTYQLMGQSADWRGGNKCAARHPLRVSSGEVTSVDVDCHFFNIAPG